MCRYIFVVGGVYSGTGKGITAASIAFLMKQRGHNVDCMKLDPYLNVNAGVLSPNEHGESYLCDDGSETDLDLGHYARLAGINPSKNNIWTSGLLHKELIEEQEEGKYLGQTIQVMPHMTQKIIEKINNLGADKDIVIVEIGGTVGDIESSGFYEAVRQFKQANPNDVLITLVAPIIYNNTVKEFKTKPLQNAISTLQSFGMFVDILFCRVDREVPEKILEKISSITNIPRTCIFDCPDVASIYQVPIEFYNRHIDDLVTDKFHLKRTGCRIHKYKELVENYSSLQDTIKIGVVGKYKNCDEAYLSMREALYHAGAANNVKVQIKWINAEDLEAYKDLRGIRHYLEDVNGIIVPGGFDIRGVEGKIKAIQYCREKKLPFLGICLGLQCAVIEFARNIVGLTDANSEEFDQNTSHKVVHFIEGQRELTKKSATMRLGAYDCELVKDTLTFSLYNSKMISERHRHRYEVNDEYVSLYEEKGFLVSGRNPESKLVEVMELKNHPFFIAAQYHMEFKSRFGNPAPLFNGFVAAAKNQDLSSKAE